MLYYITMIMNLYKIVLYVTADLRYSCKYYSYGEKIPNFVLKNVYFTECPRGRGSRIRMSFLE